MDDFSVKQVEDYGSSVWDNVNALWGVVLSICGIVLILCSFYHANNGDFPRATYELVLSLGTQFRIRK